MSSHRRNRSRSPIKSDNLGRRRDNQPNVQESMNPIMNNMNSMMLANMYQQGNMMMSGMYPNMMIANNMMANNMMGGNIMPSTGMEIMPSTGIEMMAQSSMDMSALTPQPMTGTNTSMDVNLMGGMMMDNSMMGSWNMAGNTTGNIASEMPVIQERKDIVFKYCILSPPSENTPNPPCRPKPPGCRTIFVGGLPDKIRESTVRDIFESYGRIHTLRLSKKNFCHIRFDREESVDAAMMISGYQIKLKPRDKDKEKEKDKDSEDNLRATTGWLHVDYALSRDDQSEYERKQRQTLRLQQQQMQLLSQKDVTQQDNWKRSPSPLRVTPFSTTAINHVAEKIKNEEQFPTILPTLVAWLERGECSKKNSNQFYSMLQATNSHIRRLFNEKMQAEDELQETRDRVKIRIESVIEQLEQVAKVFSAATHQRVWDHFTKPQRKNIETWQKMTQEFSTLKDEFNEKFYAPEENNMDYGNGYSNISLDTPSEELQQLKRENESLQFQLEAYKNEVDVIKVEAQRELDKFKAQFIARQVLDGAAIAENKPPLPAPQAKPPPPPPLPDDLDSKVSLKEAVEAGSGEAHLIGIMAAFLHVHPQGASLDYIVSYVRALFPHTTQATVHHVLQKHSDVFCLTTYGVGANIENKWSFIAFTERREEK